MLETILPKLTAPQHTPRRVAAVVAVSGLTLTGTASMAMAEPHDPAADTAAPQAAPAVPAAVPTTVTVPVVDLDPAQVKLATSTVVADRVSVAKPEPVAVEPTAEQAEVTEPAVEETAVESQNDESDERENAESEDAESDERENRSEESGSGTDRAARDRSSSDDESTSREDRDQSDSESGDENRGDENRGDEDRHDESRSAARADEREQPQRAEKKQEKETASAGAVAGSSIVATARNGIGVPYVYAGSSTSGWDCSGFTQWVYAQHGVSLPHSASAQKNAGTVISKSEARPGDLVYTPGHVGIYAGNGTIIDAGSSGGKTTERSMWDANWTYVRI